MSSYESNFIPVVKYSLTVDMLARVVASRVLLTYQACDKSCDELITFITQAAGTCIHLVKIKGTCSLQLIAHSKLCPGLNIPVNRTALEFRRPLQILK